MISMCGKFPCLSDTDLGYMRVVPQKPLHVVRTSQASYDHHKAQADNGRFIGVMDDGKLFLEGLRQ